MKKKILFVIGMFAGGGAEKVLVNMVNSLDQNKFDITVYSIFDTGMNISLNSNITQFSTFKVSPGSNDSVKGRNIKARIKNFVFLSFWKYFPMGLFYRFVIKDTYDVEVAYVEGMPHKVVAASSNKLSKKLAWFHIDLNVHKRSTEFYRNFQDEINCYSKFENLIFVSDYAKESFQKKYGISKNLTTKYNVNLTNEIKSKSIEKMTDNQKRHSPLFVTIGRLHEQKGYDRLLQACNELIKNGYKFELWIIGDGALHAEFHEYIVSNKLGEYIKLLGFKENPYKYLVKADWFIASSRYEGYSTVVSEALILEIPVIVTDCSGMREIIGNNNEYGILVENTTEGIIYGIQMVLDDKELYKSYKEKAMLRSQHFSKEKALKEIEILF